MDHVELYVKIDDFCKKFMPKYLRWLKNKKIIQRNRSKLLNDSEIIFIILLFTNSTHRNFKSYYIKELSLSYRNYFKQLPSYNRFVELMPRSFGGLFSLLRYSMYKARKIGNGLEFIDSTKIPICHIKRIRINKLFKGIAGFGKSSMGWFYGFKLHLMCDTQGNITNMKITKGNKDDRQPVLELAKGFKGKIFADKGYTSFELQEDLTKIGVILITTPKKNMKNKNTPIEQLDIAMHKKRSIIESIFNILKNKLQLCHTRHRSTKNFIVHIVSVLLGYQLFCNKPTINLS